MEGVSNLSGPSLQDGCHLDEQGHSLKGSSKRAVVIVREHEKPAVFKDSTMTPPVTIMEEFAMDTILFPLDLTTEAANRYPEAATFARSLEADRASLDPVKKYLMRKRKVSSEHADDALTEYLKYLLLVKITNEQLAPSEEADEAWHAHILFTQLYDPFCRRHFGRFVHHVPSDPGTHPPESFFKKQNQLGELFYGKHTIYASHHGHCSNSHSCHGHACSPDHACVPGQSCSINIGGTKPSGL